MRAGMFGTVPIIDTDMMRIIPDPNSDIWVKLTY